VIGLLVGATGLPTALASVSALAALAAVLCLAVAPERDELAGRVSDALDAGRERTVAGLTPAVVRYGPAVRRWAGDLALLGPMAGPGPDRRLDPLGGGVPALRSAPNPAGAPSRRRAAAATRAVTRSARPRSPAGPRRCRPRW
jgi:hypothetical protein